MKTILTTTRGLQGLLAVIGLALLQACATVPADSSVEVVKPIDPYERFNRSIFTFNENVDRAVVKPVASAYRDATPELLRRGVNNFFGNITDAWSLVNNTLQLKPVEATDSLFRVTVNTLWGLGGIFDVASDMGIPSHTEDFGQTLGYWGVLSGPYVVLPIFGPSTVRDSFGMLVDFQGDPVSGLNKVPVRNSLTGLRLVDKRASFLGAGELLEQAALDKYAFAREVYLQRRRSLIGSDQVEKEERYDLPEGATSTDAPAPASAPK
jgi:phospholipid-binding lipoprotein MlaA